MGSFAAEIAIAVVPPLVVAWAVAWLCRYLLPPDTAARWQLAAGAAVGFFIGYVLLPDWALLLPDRHWQWLSYLALAAAILGSATASGSISFWERLLALTVLGFIAAQTLVPHWDSLQPPRIVLVPSVAAYLIGSYLLLAWLPRAVQDRTLPGLLALSALGTAVLVGYEVSAKYGQVGVTFAAAMLGAAVSRWPSTTASRSSTATSVSATSDLSSNVVYAFVVGGLAFVGTIDPTEPALPLLFAPLTPAVLWLFAVRPLSKVDGIKSVALRTVVVVLAFVLLGAWVLLRNRGQAGNWSAA